MILLYRGYYKGHLLAVSLDKKALKSYLKDVRNLDEYEIDDSYMETDNIHKLYDGLIIQQYLKDFYLPSRDCDILDEEVEKEINHYVDTLNSMREYYQKIQFIDIMSKHADQLKETIHNMEDDLTNKKILKKLRKKIIKSSTIVNSSIEEYLQLIHIKNECDELDSLYKYHLYGND